MRNFDVTQDLEFEVHGEKFKAKTVRPEVLAAWEERVANTTPEAIQMIDEQIMLFLDNGDGSHERWKALRENEEKAISMGQLQGILQWMVEVQTELPTGPPAPSVRGRGKTAASSEAA